MTPIHRGRAAAYGVLLLACAYAHATEPPATAPESPSLYERLGAWHGINHIVRDTVTLHEGNAAISHYFKDVDRERLIESVTAFFAAGSGGPNCYEGRDMTTAHAHMGLSADDFHAAVDDVMKALASNGVGEREQGEVRTILLSLKDPVLGTKAPTP
jgi:hemoglobin